MDDETSKKKRDASLFIRKLQKEKHEKELKEKKE